MCCLHLGKSPPRFAVNTFFLFKNKQTNKNSSPLFSMAFQSSWGIRALERLPWAGGSLVHSCSALPPMSVLFEEGRVTPEKLWKRVPSSELRAELVEATSS